MMLAIVVALLLPPVAQPVVAAGAARAHGPLVVAEEVTLFDADGEPVAYIVLDDELTIYLWGGEPVAYLHRTGRKNPSIYGFNGKHLGWFESGIARDHDGDAVGFAKGAVNKTTRFESFKSFKQFKPLKGLRELEPLEPVFSTRWSSTPLKEFLAAGND